MEEHNLSEKKKRPAYLLIALFVVSIILGGAAMMIKPKNPDTSSTSSGDPFSFESEEEGIAVVRLNGIISFEPTEWMWGDTAFSTTERVMYELESYIEKDSVKAIVLVINSPGGTAVASKALYDKIVQLREKHGKPVVAALKEVAASGGYFTAAACDEIITAKGTLTGSIGVIMSMLNYTEAMKKIGVKHYAFTAGESKDMLSPFKEVKEEEVLYMEELLSDAHDEFKDGVRSGREGRLKREESFLFDGKIFNGKQAVDYGLADAFGGEQDAVVRAAELAGITNEDPPIVADKKKKMMDTFFQFLNSLSDIEVSHNLAGFDTVLTSKRYAGVPLYLYVGSALTE